ncbi:DnaQ-like DNA polymerase III subunit [Streptomyces phage Ibantik]|uniref:DnaQ-like DNA polymerase III subunit n=1 Tax=Streptomyces phage Ibantik TaxID=2182397 RepID=A0A2U8UNE8_9CAUD|nr:DnaQ-like exonuclease [Streptomyces phage Ibantik]AWN05257.1 DnaQ-like DNA polymerase III subunit [Streptomyces phage Ibantik]
MKLITLDLETSPNLANVWGLWNQNIHLPQLLESGEVICFAAKTYGEEEVQFYSTFHNGKEEMVSAAHELLDEADAVIHFNGKRFDIPHLNREFVEMELSPPSPYAQIDLLQVVKKQFRFPSNKLDYVTKALGLDHKVQNSGHTLWVKCMAGDYQAWEEMKTYNVQDVVITEQLYDRLLPWIPSHPAHGLYQEGDEETCPNCGGVDLKKRGFAYTQVSKFQQYRCEDCGKWVRGGKRLDGVEIRGVK